MSVNVGLAGTQVHIAKVGTDVSQGKQNQQVATGGGSQDGQDKMVKSNQKRRAMEFVGAKSAQLKVLAKAGVTKPQPAKKC